MFLEFKKKSGKRDSDPRPQPWQGCALPTELFPLIKTTINVKRRRLELPRHNCHYPLKVARLPIPPSLRMIQKTFSVPRTGLEPARLSTLAPDTSASTIPPPGQKMFLHILRGKRDSNSRPRPWQGRALPTELFPQKMLVPLSSLVFAFP